MAHPGDQECKTEIPHRISAVRWTLSRFSSGAQRSDDGSLGRCGWDLQASSVEPFRGSGRFALRDEPASRTLSNQGRNDDWRRSLVIDGARFSLALPFCDRT
jgi:hypothetical protein